MKPKYALLILVILPFLTGAVFLVVAVLEINKLKTSYPVVKYHDDGKTEVVFHDKKPQWWYGINQIPRHVEGAIITTEDWAFYTHNGIDFNQLKIVFEEFWETGELSRGASTISQQVVKNVFLDQRRSIARKLAEIPITMMLEALVSKKKILEVYLNIAEWGNGVVGVGRASRHYFKSSVNNLGAKEAAFLAMLLPSPDTYSSSYRKKNLTEFAESSVERILKRMKMAGYIDQESLDFELARPLPFEMQWLELGQQKNEKGLQPDGNSAENSSGDETL